MAGWLVACCFWFGWLVVKYRKNWALSGRVVRAHQADVTNDDQLVCVSVGVLVTNRASQNISFTSCLFLGPAWIQVKANPII